MKQAQLGIEKFIRFLLILILTIYCQIWQSQALAGSPTMAANDTSTGSGIKLTPPQLAARLGVSVQQIQSLQATYSLTDDQLLGLTQIQLQLYLQDLSKHPGVDRHAA